VASLFIMLWGARLSGFLLFRILKTGTDTRFDNKRDKFFPFLGFWVAQMVWVWVVSLPVTIINSPKITTYRQPGFGTGRDIAGVLLWTLGFVVESVADVQKYRFKTQQAQNGGDNRSSDICDTGLFSWSRHPNYFGEIILQFAIFTTTISPSAYSGYIPAGSGAHAAQYASILGPIFLTLLLMFVSGLTLQERPAAKKRYEKSLTSSSDGDGDNAGTAATTSWQRYKTYLQRTSILIPIPPQLYSRLPTWIKRTILLEFPIYVFDPAKHADQGSEAAAVEEGRITRQQGQGQQGDGDRERTSQSQSQRQDEAEGEGEEQRRLVEQK
jgi:steroid 5-alpha reductase family enzyme